MNRAFKSVWNESTGTFVAVAENVKSQGKRTSSGRAGAILSAIAAIGLSAGVAAPDATAAALAGENIEIQQSGIFNINQIVSTKKDVKFESVEIRDEVTIGGLFTAKDSTATIHSGVTSTFESGTITKFEDGAAIDVAGLITAGSISAVDVSATNVTAENGTFNEVSIGGNFIAANGKATVTGPLEIDIGNNKLQGVAAGEADTDAVNLGQLNAVEGLANAGWNVTDANGNTSNIKPNGEVQFTGDSNIAVDLTSTDNKGEVVITLNPDVTLNSITAVDVNATNVTAENGTFNEVSIGGNFIAANGKATVTGPLEIDMGNNKLHGVAAGSADTDAVNVSQLNTVEGLANAGWNVTDAKGNTSNIKPNGEVKFIGDSNIAVAQTGVDNKGVVAIQLADDLVVKSVTTGDTVMDNDGVRVGTSVNLTNQGLFLNGATGPSISLSGISAGGLKITNVAAGTADTDGVNFGQLKDVSQGVADLGDRAVKYDGAVGSKKDTITLEGKNGTTITNLADGKIAADSKDAVNGGQISDMGDSVAEGMGGGSTFVDGKLVTELNVAGNSYNNVNDALGGVHTDLSTKIDNVENIAGAGWNVTDADNNSANIGPNGQVAFIGDQNVTVKQTGTKDKGQVEVTLNQDLKVNSITAVNVNATKVTANEVAITNGPVINEAGIDMRDKKITNVAAGSAATDAVNVSQLSGVKTELHNEINSVRRDLHKVDRKLRAGVAAAMATAGLPQAYAPGKSMVAMGGGTWNGESGLALGVSKITDNGKWVFKASGNASTRGDYGGTVGAGYQW